MKAALAILVVLCAAVMLTAGAAAGPDVAKQRVAITTQAAQASKVSKFVLTPLQNGPLKPDSGKLTSSVPPERIVMRDGQRITVYDGSASLKGKRGMLVIRYRDEYVEAGNGYHVGIGTWKVVRGTGQYAEVTGRGRTGNVWLDRGPWSSREEGVLTVR